MNEGKKDGRNKTVIFLVSDQSDPSTGSHCAQAGCTTFEVQPLSQMASFLGGLCFHHSNPKRNQRLTSQLFSEFSQSGWQ